MQEILQSLRQFFSQLDTLEARFSKKWREGNNRRTAYVVLIILIMGTLSYINVFSPPDDFPIDQLITVADGQNVDEIAASLERQNAIRSQTGFKVLLILLGRDRGARAGDYVFKQPVTLWSITRAISVGAFGLEPTRIRIHEGATTSEMAKIFDAKLQRFDPLRFLSMASTQEGYLYPDTYYFLPNATENSVLQAMRQNFDSHIAEIQPLIASSTRPLEEIIILASIIEREAHISADRRKISGVLWNRLATNMPLQVDVTFLYTIGKGTFDLTRADLKSDSPYNTYVHKGLPPTPIGSPSMDSILAAVNPTKNDFIYYLADNTGVTHFSKTYDEHLRKKRLFLGT
jgi:UPF0755 protein